MRHKIAFIIPTKERPKELFRLLKNLEDQTYRPDQVIVVDGSREPLENIVKESTLLRLNYLRCFPPSATKQRNVGLNAVEPKITLIGFLDDDIMLEKNALEAMMKFWGRAPGEIGGAAFNMVNHPPIFMAKLKSSSLVEKFKLYSKERGKVVSSGFQTMIGFVKETKFVEWLPLTASVWSKEIFNEFKFDEWFNGYSYLEDLDFSYRVGKKYKLAVVADAKYYHYPASRESAYVFGKKEVINRIYFVKKNRELSLFRCYLTLFGRLLLTLTLGIRTRKFSYFKRAFGNVIGLFKSFSINKLC
jgi:GT2 family glycosyltransferase